MGSSVGKPNKTLKRRSKSTYGKPVKEKSTIIPEMTLDIEE